MPASSAARPCPTVRRIRPAASATCHHHTLCVTPPPAGEPAKRARQLWRFLYANHRWGRALSEADDSSLRFSSAFKRTVEASASLSGGLTVQVRPARMHCLPTLPACLPACGPSEAGQVVALLPVTAAASSRLPPTPGGVVSCNSASREEHRTQRSLRCVACTQSSAAQQSGADC